MRNGYLVLQAIKTLGLILTLGVSMSAEAGLFGIGGTSWQEEVLLHDGSKIVVERSQLREGRHELGAGPPIKDHDLTFTVPGSSKSVTWKDEFSTDVGHANFTLLALHILRGVPYVITTPDLCPAFNKWGRPNPPYVIFTYDGMAWQRIPLPELPAEFKLVNLVVNAYREDYIKEHRNKTGFVPAESVQKINSSLTQPEFKTILREPLPKERVDQMCTEMLRTNEGWEGLGFFRYQPSYEACLQYCDQKGVSQQKCPCKKLFDGKVK